MDKSSLLIFGIWLCWALLRATSGHPVDTPSDDHTHTLDHFVEPLVSEDNDYIPGKQLRTKRKNYPQMSLFLAINGDKNCQKPVYRNFHTIELNGESSNEEPNSDLNQSEVEPHKYDINNVQSVDQDMGNYLMDKLFEKGDIVPKNVTNDHQHLGEEPKDENTIDHKYQELMSAMHLVMEKMGTSKETKQQGLLDRHKDTNEYGADHDVPQSATDNYGSIIELPNSKSISKNGNNNRPESHKPEKHISRETILTEPQTIQPMADDKSDKDPKDWPDYQNFKSFIANINKDREFESNMKHIKFQDLLQKCLGISCECSKERDFPLEGTDIKRTPNHSTQRHVRPKSDENPKNNSGAHDSYSSGRPSRPKRPNRRTESPIRNFRKSDYFDKHDKTPVDEEWSEETRDDFFEKFYRFLNKKSKEESKTKLRSKSKASKVSYKEEDELKMDLVQKLAKIIFSAKNKIATNKGRAKTSSRRSQPYDTNEQFSMSDFLKQLVNLADEIPEDAHKGLPDNEDDEDEVTNLPNLSFKRNRSNMPNFYKPNHVQIARNDYADDEERSDDDYTELPSRRNYRRPKKPKIEEAEEDENEDCEAIENFNDDHQSFVPKALNRGLYRPTVALKNQRQISYLNSPNESDEEDIESSDGRMEQEAVDTHKLYHSQHLKSTIPRNNKIQMPYEIEVDDTEKKILKGANNRGSRVYPSVSRPQGKRTESNYRQQQNRSRPRPKLVTDPLELNDENKPKNKFDIPANTKKSRKSYNSKASENLPTRPQRIIDELPEYLYKGHDINDDIADIDDIDDDDDDINDHECLNRPSNTINYRKPRPLLSKKHQRTSSGEVKSSKELHILFNDLTEPSDEDAALQGTEEEQLQDEAITYFSDQRTVRRQGRSMESENESLPGNVRSGRNQSGRRETNTVTKSQRQHNHNRKAIIYREERGLDDEKLPLLESISDGTKFRDSNNGKEISDRVRTPKIDLAVDPDELPEHSNKMFANGKELSVVNPKYMDDQYEPLQETVKKPIQKKLSTKQHKGRFENKQNNQTESIVAPTATVNHPPSRRYLDLFNNFKDRVSLVTMKPAHSKYYSGYVPAGEMYAPNYS